MSTEAGFSRLVFPALRDSGQRRLEDQAHTRGHAAGYAAGLRAAAEEVQALKSRLQQEHDAAARQAREQLDQATAVLAAAADAFTRRVVPAVTDAEDSLAAAAIELTEALLGHELAAGTGTARAALERALSAADPEPVHGIRLNPADLASLDTDTRQAAGVPLVADPSLAPGDAVVDFPDGYLDARIGAALARARTALLTEDGPA